MKTRTILASLGLATVLAVGAGTAAFAAGGTTAPTDPARADRVAARCAKVPTVLEHLSENKTRLTERRTTLTDLKAKADAAGRTKASDRLAAAITRVDDRLARIGERTTKVTDWSSAHCDAPAPTPAPSTAG